MRHLLLLVATLLSNLAPTEDGSDPIDAAPLAQESRPAWPPDWEREFQARKQRVLKGMCLSQKADGLGNRTYFENEKRAYGFLMAHLLAGDQATALRELQKEDAQARAWHAHTSGIDYYACFTLKHQVRKYFLFGDRLDPAYRQRMFDGARAWTERDPLRRPHPAFVKPGDGWGPDVKNSWVDVRSTENLFLMRVGSVYLMAEETGNEATRNLYKSLILRYVASLYRVGMGEWDSENYHGHSIPPLLNLYDFARDPEVKAAAQAGLDYLHAIGAVKYFRAAFNGPTNRDYSHSQPFGGSAPRLLWLFFGDAPQDNTRYESDEVHVLSSRYRPPEAVVRLARKEFDRPAELFASKPGYSATTGHDWTSPPEFFETQFFGRTFQIGSLVNGTTAGQTAVNGFKIVARDATRGAVALQAVPGPDPRFVGSARYVAGKVSGENRVGQHRNLAVWLVRNGKSPWVWVLPESVVVETNQGVTFLRCESTWVALHPIRTSPPKLDPERTRALTTTDKDKNDPLWNGHRVLSAQGKGGAFCGVAVEVGEAPDFADFAAFKRATLDHARLNLDRLDQGEAEFLGAKGQRARLRFADQPSATSVWRDGVPHDWTEHARHLYRPAPGSPAIIEQTWLGGTLTIRAGGAVFTATVDPKGRVTSHNK